MKLPMPEGEIVARYRSMAAGQDRLVILAELNNTSRSRIADVLARHGVAVERPRRGTRQPSMDYGRARELYGQGLTDMEIAQELGVADDTVRKWRRKYGLSINLAADRRRRRFRELYDQGLSDAEIARRCGVAPSTVGTWRRKAGLGVNN